MASATHRGRVEWIDTDAAGIHHNSAIIRYVESAEAGLMRRYGVHDYFGRAPRVHYEVDFEASLRFGQEIVAELSIESIGTSSMTFAFEVWGEAHEGRRRRRVAKGRYVTVCVDNNDRGSPRSTPWPPAWLESLTSADAVPDDGVLPRDQLTSTRTTS